MKNWIAITANENGGKGCRDFGFGIKIYIHKHMNIKCCRYHFHICIDFAFWYVELKISQDDIDE